MTDKTRGYIVPDPIDPGDTVCLKVYIPASQLYVAAFMRAYQYFGQWVAWERDSTGKAAQAAAVWREAIERTVSEFDAAGGVCSMTDVRQSSTTPCILEKDIGEGWEAFANLALCAPNMRVRNGVIQQETSPGVWEDVTQPVDVIDDRINGPVTPLWTNPPAGETGNCLAAANTSTLVNVVAYEIANTLGGVYEFSGLLAIVAGYLGGAATGIIGVISLMLLGVAAWLVESWNDIRDYDTTSDLTDILACLFNDSGVMSTEDWSTALAQIDNKANECGTDACIRRWNLVKAIVNVLGPVGMSRMAAASGIETAECTACPFDWVHTFDFTTGTHDWVAQDYSGVTAGVHVPGVGWRGVWSGGDAFRIFLWSDTVASTNFKALEFAIDWEETQRDFANWWGGVITSGGDLVGPMVSEGGIYSPPPIPEGVFYGEASYTNQRLRFNCGNTKLPRDSHNNGDVGGSTLSYIRVWGVGTDPWA